MLNIMLQTVNTFIFHQIFFFLSLGIDVKKGRGRYIDTCLVTFAPRYLLDNKSTHKLAFAQREFARGQVRGLSVQQIRNVYF